MEKQKPYEFSIEKIVFKKISIKLLFKTLNIDIDEKFLNIVIQNKKPTVNIIF